MKICLPLNVFAKLSSCCRRPVSTKYVDCLQYRPHLFFGVTVLTGRATSQAVSVPDCHRGGQSSIPGESVWDMWWQNGSWDKLLRVFRDFPLSVPFQQCSIHIPSLITDAEFSWHRGIQNPCPSWDDWTLYNGPRHGACFMTILARRILRCLPAVGPHWSNPAKPTVRVNNTSYIKHSISHLTRNGCVFS